MKLPELEELYRRYRMDLYRYLCFLTHDPVQAEDLLSETFVRVIKRLPTFRGECEVKTWLFGIARNIWLESLRRRHQSVSLDDLMERYITDDALTETTAARQKLRRVQALLQQKDERTRSVVYLRAQGKALPGTANLFMLRQLLGIPLEAADMEATDLEGTTGTEKSGTLANTEKAESLTAKQKWMLLTAAAILLWFALQFVGLGTAVGLLLLLLILMIVLFLIAIGKSGIVAAAKSTGKRMLYLIAAMLLALVLWSVAFVASANYQSKAIWSMPQEEWQSYPEVAAWMQHCETMGNGVYMQRVDLPSDQGNTIAYLVCRNGVTNEQAGKITPNPLRLRFWVTYQAGESEPMMLDVLTFQGNKDYQVFFRIGKEQSDCIFTTNESEALAGEVRSLLESRANDK